MNALELLRQSNAGGRQRGAALLLVLMVTVVLLILMGTLIDVLQMESQNAIENADADAALTAAYSGVDLMILAIEEFYQNGVQNGKPPQSTTCNFGAPVGTTVTTSCDVKVVNSWSGTGLNYYLINSTGDAKPSQAQEVQRSVSALVKEVPFGAYAMFTETETSNTGVHVWYSSGQAFTGPVYSGGNMHVRYDSGYDKCDNPPCPIFPYGFTTSGNPNNMQWYDIADQDNSPPNTPAELASVFGPGNQANFVHNQISLPALNQNLAVFSEAYYGDSNHADLTDLQNAGCNENVCVNAGASNCGQQLCTGVFINGSANLQATSVAGTDLTSGSQTWTFSPPDKNSGDPNPISNTVTVTVNFNQGTTTVIDGGNTSVYQGLASGSGGNSGLGNGAIFVNGDLNVLDGGTVHGEYTVALPDPPQTPDQSITLRGSLQYSADPTKEASQDELALWADKIWLNSNDPNVVIDGMLLTGYANECQEKRCGGYFANINCDINGCDHGKGALNLYGSIIENMRGMMGVVDTEGHLESGYLRTAGYDPRLGSNPPPFSPTTNLYDVIAVTDQGSP